MAHITQKTLADISDVLLAKKRAWNVDMNLEVMVVGTEIGSVAVTGKIEYIPQEALCGLLGGRARMFK